MTICQTGLIMTLNCVILSKWVPNLISQAYCKFPQICFLYTFCRPNEQPKFDVSFQHPRFTIHYLMVFRFEKVLTENLRNSLFIITYRNITETFHLINSKHLPEELCATTATDFLTLPLLILLKMWLLNFFKMCCQQCPFLLQ